MKRDGLKQGEWFGDKKCMWKVHSVMDEGVSLCEQMLHRENGQWQFGICSGHPWFYDWNEVAGWYGFTICTARAKMALLTM